MNICFKKMTADDIEAFIDVRLSQLTEEGENTATFGNLCPALRDYYKRHLADGTFVSWLAYCEDQIIATSGISFVERPPYSSAPNGKIGLLSSMFTKKEYRRRGIAKTLLTRIMNDAKEYGCGNVQIAASDMGVLLYTDYGFKRYGNFMHYKFQA